jgi:dimethylglycine dehydrogenase
LLADLTVDDVSNDAFPFLAVRELDFGVCKARTIRISFSGDLGYEIHVPSEYQRALYDLIKLKGSAYELRLAGSRALSTLRLEKGFLFFGLDLNIEVNPFQAGLDFMVNFNKPRFIGREALVALQKSKPHYREVLVEVDTLDADCVGGEPIFRRNELVGQVTSGGYGHWCQKSLAIAWLKAEHAEGGQEVSILLYGNKLRATVMERPPFDPCDVRMRS